MSGPKPVDGSLDSRGYAHLGQLLSASECDEIAALYLQGPLFRSHIRMQRHGFGQGEYKYFGYPLPPRIAMLRETLYPKLAPVANRWCEQLRLANRFPDTHLEMLERCHKSGQTKPTPLVLRYGPGDFNCLHQDLYGEHVFPIQVVILLSDPDQFGGGEFVVTEQRPRMQSRVEVITIRRGHGVAFAVNERPKAGSRGFYKVRMRHGVSEIRAGERFSLGIIFHDAK